MNALLQLFDVNNIMFTLLDYPISYIEFAGTIFNLACVWLVARKNILNWPIGIIGVILFGILFYQINLYADLFEQFYYLVTGFWGWYVWTKLKKPNDSNEDITVLRNTKKENIIMITTILVTSVIGGWALARIHVWLPDMFPEPAALPFLDTLTTMMSFAAQFLMIKRRLENWILWIIVDVIAVGLYWYKQVPFIALLYLIFLFIATSGLINWTKTYRRQ